MGLLAFLKSFWKYSPASASSPQIELPAPAGLPQEIPGASVHQGSAETRSEPQEAEIADEARRMMSDFSKRLNSLDFRNTARTDLHVQTLKLRKEVASIDRYIAQAGFIEWTNRSEILLLLDEIEIRAQPLFTHRREKSILVAVVDTETTGLGERDEPISVGVILLEVSGRKGEVIEEVGSYYGLREPTVPITPEAQAVHGIEIGELRGKDLDIVRLHQLLDSAEMFIAHNAKFDRRMMSKIVPHLMHARWACSIYTLKEDWANLGDGRRSLDAICEALSIQRSSPHNSLSDCLALISVLKTRAGDGRSSTRMARLIRNAWAPPV